MKPFVIHTTGRAEIPHPAERAVINIVTSSSGTNKAAVSDDVVTTAVHVEKLLRELSPKNDTAEAKDAAALAHWSKTSLTATSFIPASNRTSSSTMPRQYNASISFDVRFKDFKAMGPFAARVSALPHVSINGIQWILTAATQGSFRTRLRKEAAQDALRKARDYCEVLNCSNIRPVELTETGSWAPAGKVSYQQAQVAPGMMGISGSGGGGQRDESPLEFTPQEVRMHADVTIEFHADYMGSTLSYPSKRVRSEDDDMDGM